VRAVTLINTPFVALLYSEELLEKSNNAVIFVNPRALHHDSMHVALRRNQASQIAGGHYEAFTFFFRQNNRGLE
jgi:hypothetical protein